MTTVEDTKKGREFEACHTAETFAKLFYDRMDAKRHVVGKLYLDSAVLSWNGNKVWSILQYITLEWGRRLLVMYLTKCSFTGGRIGEHPKVPAGPTHQRARDDQPGLAARPGLGRVRTNDGGRAGQGRGETILSFLQRVCHSHKSKWALNNPKRREQFTLLALF